MKKVLFSAVLALAALTTLPAFGQTVEATFPRAGLVARRGSEPVRPPPLTAGARSVTMPPCRRGRKSPPGCSSQS